MIEIKGELKIAIDLQRFDTEIDAVPSSMFHICTACIFTNLSNKNKNDFQFF